jgi:hypothetical protein
MEYAEQMAGHVWSFNTPDFTVLTGPNYMGRTYSGQPGTATSRFDIGTGGVVYLHYAVVYSTTAEPLVTFPGSDGQTYGVRAILYAEYPLADLSITKTGGLTGVRQGQTVTYAIVATNAGPNAVGADEVQTITTSATGGTFTIDFEGETTAALPYNASAAQVQAALNGLSTIGGEGGEVTVTFGAGVYTVTFGGSLARTDVPPLLIDGSSLTGGNAAVATITDGSGPATITDIVPPGLVGVTYTAVQTGGASGFTAAGSGSINDTNVSMPVGSTITYSVSGTVEATTGSLVNAARIVASAVITDPAPGNNAAIDRDNILPGPIPAIPSLNLWGIILFSILLVGSTFYAFRKRRIN